MPNASRRHPAPSYRPTTHRGNGIPDSTRHPQAHGHLRGLEAVSIGRGWPRSRLYWVVGVPMGREVVGASRALCRSAPTICRHRFPLDFRDPLGYIGFRGDRSPRKRLEPARLPLGDLNWSASIPRTSRRAGSFCFGGIVNELALFKHFELALFNQRYTLFYGGASL